MAVAISGGMGVTFAIAGTAIGEVVSISGPSYSKETVETTNLSFDTGEHFRTYLQGMNDAGEVSLQVLFDADEPGQALVMTELEADVGSDLLTYLLTLNDAGTANASSWSFVGSITKGDFGGIDVDGRITMDLTIKISGKPTYTPAADTA